MLDPFFTAQPVAGEHADDRLPLRPSFDFEIAPAPAGRQHQQTARAGYAANVVRPTPQALFAGVVLRTWFANSFIDSFVN